MNNSRLRSFIWIPPYAIGKCSEIQRSKWSILSLFSKSRRRWQNKFLERFRCSNIHVLPTTKRAEKHRMISLKCGKIRFFPESFAKGSLQKKGSLTHTKTHTQHNTYTAHTHHATVYTNIHHSHTPRDSLHLRRSHTPLTYTTRQSSVTQVTYNTPQHLPRSYLTPHQRLLFSLFF